MNSHPAGASSRAHNFLDSGKPWMRTTGRPDPRLATRVVTPFAVTADSDQLTPASWERVAPGKLGIPPGPRLVLVAATRPRAPAHAPARRSYVLNCQQVTSLSPTEPSLVADAGDLARLARQWKREPILAVDTEAASFHRFLNRIYLIQVSNRESTWIVDPVAVEDLAPFGEILASPKVEVVFHDADYDLRLFDHQYGFQVRNLFDTRAAAELLNEPGLSLAALLERYFDVRMDKRFQRADWSNRPLSPEMLAYAAADTSHLVGLRDLLAGRLEEAGRLEWAREEFTYLEQVRWTTDDDREPAWLRLKGAKALKPRQLAILREVHGWRVALATKLDRAEFRILGNEALLAIATSAPATIEDLGAIKGVGKDTLQRRGKALLAAVRRAEKLAEGDLPRIPRPPRRQREPEIESRIARLKAARSGAAERLGLATGVICPNSVIEAIARQNPADLRGLAEVAGMRQWQVKAFGADLLEAIRTP